MKNKILEKAKIKDSKQEKGIGDKSEVFYALSLVSKLGFSIVIIIGVFLWIGIYLDRRFETGFIFSFIFLVLSVPASIYNIYYLLEPIIGSEKRKNFLKRKKR